MDCSAYSRLRDIVLTSDFIHVFSSAGGEHCEPFSTILPNLLLSFKSSYDKAF